MSQVLDALPTDRADKILCHYSNPLPKLQIIRITNISHWYFERIVFPGELCFFEATAEAMLEVYRGDGTATLLSDRIACKELRV